MTIEARTALLVMDVQRGIVERYPEAGPLLERLGKVIDAARAAEIPVIYVTVRFREGYPEVSPNNRTFSAAAQRGGSFSETSAATEIHPNVAPREGEIVVTKRRVSAFTGSDLDVVLRAQGIETLVLTGIATSGVVLSTTRQAADLDFRIIILSDCVADADPEVHRVLTEKVFPRQAEIMTSEEWIAGTARA
jgi:nicotinamidase-related amidase